MKFFKPDLHHVSYYKLAGVYIVIQNFLSLLQFHILNSPFSKSLATSKQCTLFKPTKPSTPVNIILDLQFRAQRDNYLLSTQ